MPRILSCHKCYILVFFSIAFSHTTHPDYNFNDNEYLKNVCEILRYDLPTNNEKCEYLVIELAIRYHGKNNVKNVEQLLLGEFGFDNMPVKEQTWKKLFARIGQKYEYAEQLLEELEIKYIPETYIQWAEIRIRMKYYANNLLDSQIQHSIESLLGKQMNEPSQFRKSFLDLAYYFKLIPRSNEVKILNKFGAYNLKWSLIAIKNDLEVKKNDSEVKSETITMFSKFCKRFSVIELLRFGIKLFISNFFHPYKSEFNKVDKCYTEFINYNMKRALQLQHYAEEIIILSQKTENRDVDFESKWAGWTRGLHIYHMNFPKVPYNVETAATCLKDGLLRLWNSSNAKQALEFWKKDIPHIWSKMNAQNDNGKIVYSKDDTDVMDTLSRAPPDYLRNLKFENEIRVREEDRTSLKEKSYAATLFYSHLNHAEKYKECVWIFDFNNCADVTETKKDLSDIWHISVEDFCENFYYLWGDTSIVDAHRIHFQLVREKCKPTPDDIKDYVRSIRLKYPRRAITASIMLSLYSAGIIYNSSILEPPQG